MEPERPIEKLLRIFAKKRREQAGDPPGFELHPATRRMLQGEVARRAPPQREGSFFLRLFTQARPRLAFALGVTAVVVLGVALLLPWLNHAKPKHELASAKMDTFDQAKKLPDQPATAPASAPPISTTTTTVAWDDGSASRKKLATSVDEELKNQPGSRATPMQKSVAGNSLEDVGQIRSRSETQLQPATRGGAVGGFGGSSTVTVATGRDRTDVAYKNEIDSRGATLDGSAARAQGERITTNSIANFSFAAGEPAARDSQPGIQAELPARSLSLNAGAGMGGGGGGGAAAPSTATRSFVLSGNAANLNRQNFVQWSEDSKRVSSPSNAVPILTNFAVEQNGGQMRVVDSDGSVYDGVLQWVGGPTTAFADKPAETDALLAKDAAGKEKAFATAQNYFRVAGTNRSLKQNVVFTGSFLNLTNSAMSLQPAGPATLGLNQSETIPALLQQVPLQNSVINGAVEVNNSLYYRIQATPAPTSSQQK